MWATLVLTNFFSFFHKTPLSLNHKSYISKMPGATHRFAEQTRSGRIVENLLGVRIKVYFSPQQHSNLAEVARRRRAVRHLTRCDCRLSVFNAVEEIPPMTRRFV